LNNFSWSWLLIITKRIKAAAPRKPRKYHLVTSDRLYALGIELMDHAVAEAEAAERISKAHALEYRDGLIIALTALIPLRSRRRRRRALPQYRAANGIEPRWRA